MRDCAIIFAVLIIGFLFNIACGIREMSGKGKYDITLEDLMWIILFAFAPFWWLLQNVNWRKVVIKGKESDNE